MSRTVATNGGSLIRLLTVLVVAALSAFAQPAGASNYTLKKLYSFCAQAGCTDAAPPYSGLVMSNGGALFGVANAGGASGKGAVYALTAKSGNYKFSTVYDFCQNANCSDGATPVGDLILDVDGNLYGTTFEGGAHESGVIFRLTKSGGTWVYKVLRNFCSRSNCQDGGTSAVGLSYQGLTSGAAWDKQTALFGTAINGGTHRNGVIFEFKPNGSNWDYSVIHNLITGFQPNTVLVDTGGNLFITDVQGGKYNAGVLYRLAKDTWSETTIHNFCNTANCPDGQFPEGKLTLDADGNVFGITNAGGANSFGVAFEHPASGGYSVIYNFCSRSACADGAGATSLFTGASGALIGTAAGGGAEGKGVAFALTLKSGTWHESILHSFCAGGSCDGGSFPVGTLIEDGMGNLFGTADEGGTSNCNNGCGTVYELKP